MTLAAAGVLFSVQFLFTKQYQLRAGAGWRPAIWMLVFANLWMGFLFLSAGGFRLRILPASLLYAVVYAVCAAVNNAASLFAMRLGKVAVVTLFSLSGGLLLPSAYGVIRLGEPLTAGKAAGTLLIVLASFGCLFGKQDERAAGSPRRRFWLLCLAVFVSNGMVSVVTKAHAIRADTGSSREFLTLTSLLGLIASAAILLPGLLKRTDEAGAAGLRARIGRDLGGKRAAWTLVLLTGGYAVCNGLANVCSMHTAKTMDSSLQFPLLSAMVVVFTALLAWAVFHEKTGRGDAAGLGLTVAGMALLVL